MLTIIIYKNYSGVLYSWLNTRNNPVILSLFPSYSWGDFSCLSYQNGEIPSLTVHPTFEPRLFKKLVRLLFTWKSNTYLWELVQWLKMWALELTAFAGVLPHTLLLQLVRQPWTSCLTSLRLSLETEIAYLTGSLGRILGINTHIKCLGLLALNSVGHESHTWRFVSFCVWWSLSRTHILLCLICGKFGSLNWEELGFVVYWELSRVLT